MHSDTPLYFAEITYENCANGLSPDLVLAFIS